MPGAAPGLSGWGGVCGEGGALPFAPAVPEPSPLCPAPPFAAFSFLLRLLFSSPAPTSSSCAPPRRSSPLQVFIPSPPLLSHRPAPSALLLPPGAPSSIPHPVCSMPGGPVPLTVGGQALPPACPCAAALGTLWWVGEVSRVPFGSASDPVPLSPQKVEEVGAWALGWGRASPSPVSPSPSPLPMGHPLPFTLQGVGGDITLPAEELSIKIPFPTSLPALPPQPPASGKGGVSPVLHTGFPFPPPPSFPTLPDHPHCPSTPKSHCSF